MRVVILGSGRGSNAEAILLAQAAGKLGRAEVVQICSDKPDAGILARRKEGLQVFYAIADPSIFELCELVCGSLEKQHTQRAEVFAR